MRAEIDEQPEVLSRLIARAADELRPLAQAARHRHFAVLAARGSSDNAATFGKYLLESTARLPTALAAPSLFTLYGRPPRLQEALVIGVSQSGAAADVIAVLEEGRRQGALTLAITNTPASPITAASEHVLLLGAGVERALAATKTVTAQCAAFAALAAEIAEDATLRAELAAIPTAVADTLACAEALSALAQRWREVSRLAVVARGYPYSAAQEIALKLKETCYITAEAYSAADFLHGPLAMVEPGYPVLALLSHDAAAPMVAEVIEKVASRGAAVSCLVTRQAAPMLGHLREVAEAVVLPDLPARLSPVGFIVAGQLLALSLALLSGHDPDRSRHVTKVTVTR